jgi:hypothetical protein
MSSAAFRRCRASSDALAAPSSVFGNVKVVIALLDLLVHCDIVEK